MIPLRDPPATMLRRLRTFLWTVGILGPPPVRLADPACPYCGVIQDPPPIRRRKCRDCGERIHPWTDAETQTKYLLTAKQHAQREQEAWDADWQALSKQVIAASREGDLHGVHFGQFRQALMLFDAGRDHQRVAAESRRSEILYYQRSEPYRRMGVTHVGIATGEEAACDECRPLHGRVLAIDDALAQMPIPVRTCRTRAENNPHGGWCRCHYDPQI